MLNWLVFRMSPYQLGVSVYADVLQLIVDTNQCVIEALIEQYERWATTWDTEGNTANAESLRGVNKVLRVALR